MKLFGLCGRKQSGKDTFANISAELLGEHRSRALALAEPLKEFCMDYCGLSWKSCYGTDEEKNEPCGTWNLFGEKIRVQHSKSPEDPISGREIMQVVGTEVFRDCFRGTFWVDLARNKIKDYQLEESSGLAVFVTDVRFPNEVELVKEFGGKLVRVKRDANQQDQIVHRSETELASLADDDFDYVIDNSGDLAALRVHTEYVLTEEGLL